MPKVILIKGRAILIDQLAFKVELDARPSSKKKIDEFVKRWVVSALSG